MKEAFCATNPPGSKSLCAAPSSQFRTASTKTARPTTSLAGSPSSGHSDVMTWYCSKPGKVDEPVCARHKVTTQLRTPGLKVEERKQLADQLRLNPVAYATTQAIYADYCKLPGNAEKPTCTRLKTTAAAKAMREWYCTQPGKADSSEWCKRAALLEKLQKIPATTTDTAKAADRKQLTAEYAAFSKRPEGGGPSRATAANKELFEAKKEYCALDANKALAYCKIRPPSTFSLGSSFASPGAALRGKLAKPHARQ